MVLSYNQRQAFIEYLEAELLLSTDDQSLKDILEREVRARGPVRSEKEQMDEVMVPNG